MLRVFSGRSGRVSLPRPGHPAILTPGMGFAAQMGRKLRMTDPKTRVVAIGEVMIEMARGNDGRFSTACGGDTFNTAVYLARAGVDVAYATALGDDPTPTASWRWPRRKA